jgi:hypothetical protein
MYLCCDGLYTLIKLTTKTRKIMKIKSFLLASLVLLVACNDDAPNTPEITLDKPAIAFENAGGEQVVKLIGRGKWTAGEMPEWVTLNHTSGDGSKDITVSAQSNTEPETREATVVFSCEADDTKTATLTISQAVGKKELGFGQLSFASFDKVEYTPGTSADERIYLFETYKLFANPEMREKLFLGNLIHQNMTVNTDVDEYTGDYTFIPIDVSSEALVPPTSFMPSYAAQQAYADEIIAAKPNANYMFISTTGGANFGSHRELNLIGRGNMGVALDELLSGKSYSEQEMTKKNGFIFSFSQTKFTLDMDIFSSENDFNVTGSPDIAYINTVGYGRFGMLIVETDNSLSKVKAVVRRLLTNGAATLTAEETAIVNELDAWHVYYNSSLQLKATKGKADAIAAYKTQVSDNIGAVYPYWFSVAKYSNNASTPMSYKITLP